MKKTFRILSLLLVAAMLFAFAACGKKVESPELKVGVLKGPTGVGAVSIADKAVAKKNGVTDSANITEGNYAIEFYETANVAALQTNIINGTVDIAVVPINAASALYNKSEGAVKVIAVNALGVLSIVGQGEYSEIRDLSGVTIYTINQGQTPEHILRYVLKQNGLDPDTDVKLVFHSTPTDAVAAATNDVKNGGKAVAMIPEPAVTSSKVSDSTVKVLFNMTEEWDKVSETKLVQGVLVARKEVIEKNPEAIALFIKEYKASVDFVNGNPAAAASSIVNYGIVPKEKIAEMAIPGCNVVCYN